MLNEYLVAAYYYPNYHLDAANQIRHGEGWTEWELVKKATPRFLGHKQPLQPMFGYQDEADPAVMEEKIQMALDHSVNCFIFDWYWHNEGPHLDQCLNKGFLQAQNNHKLKFALMWANHDMVDIHPISRASQPSVFNSGSVTPEIFHQMTNTLMDEYFSKENYLTINGGKYFSIYELNKFIQSFGSLKEAKKAIEGFRERVDKKHLWPIHLNCIIGRHGLLPGESYDSSSQTMKHVKELGFDSITSYVWIHHIDIPHFPSTDYRYYSELAMKDWAKSAELSDLPYYPNVTVGWDASPRVIASDMFENRGYPYTPVLTDNTPEALKNVLSEAKKYLDKSGLSEKLLTINAWNEWTEGSYLEPDLETGFQRLEAVKEVFHSNS